MPTRVAINGFGRIGRAVVRSAVERGADLEIVAVNDVAEPDAWRSCWRATRSTAASRPRSARDGDDLRVDGRAIRALREPDPGELPWAELGVDVVIESTGRFRTRADAERAPRGGRAEGHPVRPGEGRRARRRKRRPGRQLREVYDPRAPPHHHERVVHDELPGAGGRRCCTRRVGIRHGLMTTIHAYTADQNLLDAPAQGHAPRARRGGQPRADVDRRGEGDRARHPRARRASQRLRRARARCPTGSIVDLTIEAERADERRGDQRRVRRARARAARWPASSSTARSRSSRPTSSARRTRRSSTRR